MTGIPIADLLCTNGVLRTPARFAIKWKNTTGLDPNADTDGDGLSDWDEVFRHETDPKQSDTDGDNLSDASEILTGGDPLDADEDGDGIPDGVPGATWAACPLWGDVAGKTNLILSLDSTVPVGGAATLILGSHAIPLRTARSWALCIPEGPVTPFELRTMNGAVAALSLSEPSTGAPDPIHLDDPDDVFRVEAPVRTRSSPAHSPSPGGSGHLCVFDARFVNCDTGEPAPENECVHDESGDRRLTIEYSDPVHEGIEPTWSGTCLDFPGCYSLHVSMTPGDTATAEASYSQPELVCGTKNITASIHRCAGGRLAWCHACGMLHDPNDEHACPHRDGCPAKDSDSADCTCPVPVIRVTGDGTPLSERAELDFPTEAFCCCSRPGLFTYARLTHVDSNLSVWNAVMPTNWVDSHQCPDSATVLATDESGATPSRIDYQLVRRRYDDHGTVATNEVFGTGSLRVWATTLTLEPVTTVLTGGRIVNPCGIATNETAVFRMGVSPAAFPDDLIEWSAFPNGRIRFVDDDDTGREVSVLGLHPGDVTLTANVRGYAGPPPLVRARVMPRTTVPVYAWIVCGTNGVPSVEESELRGKFPEINRIWDQVGITWQLAEVNFVTNQAWMTILDDANRDTILSTICSYGNAPEGVELYCVESIAGNGGLTGRRGSIVVGQQSPAVFAHEFGHLCGLKDIYSSRPPKTDLIVSGAASRDRLEHDWPSEVEEGYYPIDFQQADIIGRLLMNGRSSTASVQTDISAGDVLGIWNHWRKDEETNIWGWHHDIDMVPIGFLLHGNKQPTVLP